MTPYFITNKNEFEEILKPLLLSWGYKMSFGISPDWKRCDKLILNDDGKLGKIWVYESLDINTYNRYLEPNIHKFLITAAELMGKEYKPFLGNKDVVWCPTEKLANQVLEISNKLGYSWSTGKDFRDNSSWDTYREHTCYFIYGRKFAYRNFYQERNYNIISAEEFINFYEEYLKDMEKRNIAISLNEAKEWYKSGNATLKELALKAYSKEELEYIDFNKIYESVPHTTPEYYIVPDCESIKWSIIHKLTTIAQYFNSKCLRLDAQYFIKGKYENEIQFGKHEGVRYPGIVYFNRQEDLVKATQLIGEDIKYLFC